MADSSAVLQLLLLQRLLEWNLAAISSVLKNLLFENVISELVDARLSHAAVLLGSSSFKNHKRVNLADMDSAGSNEVTSGHQIQLSDNAGQCEEIRILCVE
ncbi:hypothetical protein VNO78_29042 [Psophocarpus tetragonolobus]|uniref:Uncharacterized protein n=1 Tax=Psophocarpus tetragonolobus TaxID=3891 RepID=A0AAN9RU76_PSOTE